MLLIITITVRPENDTDVLKGTNSDRTMKIVQIIICTFAVCG